MIILFVLLCFWVFFILCFGGNGFGGVLYVLICAYVEVLSGVQLRFCVYVACFIALLPWIIHSTSFSVPILDLRLARVQETGLHHICCHCIGTRARKKKKSRWPWWLSATADTNCRNKRFVIITSELFLFCFSLWKWKGRRNGMINDFCIRCATKILRTLVLLYFL